MYQYVHSIVPARRKENFISLPQMTRQHIFSPFNGIGSVSAEHFPSPLNAIAPSGPRLLLTITRLHKENETLSTIMWQQRTQAIRFRKPRQIQKIVVLSEPVFNIV
jgi:hypothetical protein